MLNFENELEKNMRRKPTKLLEIQGTLRRDRHGKPEQHFELPSGVPTPPPWLKGEALARWVAIVQEPAYGLVLSALDGAALLAHCVAWQTIADKYQAGDTVLAADLAALGGSLQRLGLSPSDRARIKLPEVPKVNKWAKFNTPTG